jgi:cell division protein FtsW
MAVVLRLLPVVGVTLPFVSYGGSSLLATLAAVGLLVSCARQEPAARKVLARRRSVNRARVTAVVDGRG